jgi:hypothetical protein
MIRYIKRLLHTLFPPVTLTDEELREVQRKVYQEFLDRQQDLATPLLSAMQKAKEDETV